MRYPLIKLRSLLPHHRLILDALFAAVLLTILGLTSSFFIQALVDFTFVLGRKPALNWLGLGMLLVTLARAGFLGLRSYLLAHLSPRIDAETVPGYHRHLLGLPLTFFSCRPGETGSRRSLYALAAVLSLAVCVSLYWSARREGDRIKIIAGTTGRISTLYVKEGEIVHTGDAILQLDTRDLLLKRRFLESKIHFTELGGDAARAGLGTLYHDLEQTNLDLTRLTITSPADGKIASVAPLHANEVLHAGALIAILIPTSPPAE